MSKHNYKKLLSPIYERHQLYTLLGLYHISYSNYLFSWLMMWKGKTDRQNRWITIMDYILISFQHSNLYGWCSSQYPGQYRRTSRSNIHGRSAVSIRAGWPNSLFVHGLSKSCDKQSKYVLNRCALQCMISKFFYYS